MSARTLAAFFRPIIGLVLLLSLTAARSHAFVETVDPFDALPRPGDLKNYTVTYLDDSSEDSKGYRGCSLSARRDTDDLRLHLRISIAQTEEMAAKFAQGAVMSQAGNLPPCSHTGRRFGDEVWHTVETDGGPVHSSFTLITRMGRALIHVSVSQNVEENSRHELPTMDEADLRFTEDLTITCLQRLASRGIGTMAKATPVPGPRVADVLREVVSSTAQTPGYSGAIKKRQAGNGEIEIRRNRDGLRLKVHVSLSKTIQESMELASKEATLLQLEKGSLTGYGFGNEAWHRIGNKKRTGNSFSLLTRMGEAIVRVDAIGLPVGQAPDPADLQLAEDITVGCLGRLAEKGIGWKLFAWRHPPMPEPEQVPADQEPADDETEATLELAGGVAYCELKN